MEKVRWQLASLPAAGLLPSLSLCSSNTAGIACLPVWLVTACRENEKAWEEEEEEGGWEGGGAGRTVCGEGGRGGGGEVGPLVAVISDMSL